MRIDIDFAENSSTLSVDMGQAETTAQMNMIDIPAGAKSQFVMWKDVDDTISSTSNHPLANEAVYSAISNAVAYLELEMPKIYFGLTQYWNAEQIISEENAIYVYTDYQQKDGKDLAGLKVGDGSTYLIDLPFIDALYWAHIHDSDIHVTAGEKEFWNNKVTAYYSLTTPETLVLTKGEI